MIAVDTGNGAKNIQLEMLAYQAWFKSLRKGLDEKYKVYFDYVREGKMDQIPTEDKGAFNSALEALMARPDIARLNTLAEGYGAGKGQRLDDTQTVAEINKHYKPGEKALVIYGQAHMAENKPKGLDNLLQAQGLRVKRIDLLHSADVIDYYYKPGEDLPDLVFAADTGQIFRLHKALTTYHTVDLSNNNPPSP